MVAKGLAIWLVLLVLASGCGSAPGVYSKSESGVDIRVEQQFTIALDSNPTTGYEWEAQFDKSMLKLVETKFEPGEPVKPGIYGIGGKQMFIFQGLSQGKTSVTLMYKRPWEEKAIEQRTFTVNIK
jgi:inhibitor of cysteine peptidase